ncbi:Regulatory protein afsR [Actinoplanes sp. SE50]|nr:Regulatory protein afsR [Actinoplanes sp. SE50/110]ATO84061.1 Regulatory protein afsR [Actinoplanes sp. SE50]
MSAAPVAADIRRRPWCSAALGKTLAGRWRSPPRLRLVDFQLLGAVRAVHNGQTVPLGRKQERCALAVLALDAGRPVPVARIADLLWHGDPPHRARGAIQAMISHLRAAFRAVDPEHHYIVGGEAGYLLDVAPQAVDINRFTALVSRGRATDVTETRADILAQAMALWRGPLLGDIADDVLRARLSPDIDELHLQAREDWLAARLELGDHDEVTARLKRLVDEHPLRERARRLLMLSLYRGGRRQEALAVYRDTRTVFVEELGLEPGPEMQHLHRTVLSAEAATPGLTVADAPVAPAELPADLATFVGREPQVAQLDEVLTAVGRPSAPAVIATISGSGGVGKTSLAVHWAQRVRPHFPDGQLFVNLRGFDASAAPMSVEDALRGLLHSLGMRPDRIPPATDRQAALYRSLLAGKRMLVVLDNARDAEQVRPLLPGAPGCLVIVTSRNQLPGLVATDGATPVALGLLGHAEGRRLLRRRLGGDRIDADTGALDRIVDRCAGLPLALAVVAARMSQSRRLTLGDLAAELAESRTALDTLGTGDRASDLRSVFAWSYQALSRPAARLFRLLGLHPGPDVSVHAAAALADLPIGQARRILAELTRANLLSEPTYGRFAAHDLLWAYAVGLAESGEPPQERRAARLRLLEHYAAMTLHAAELLLPGRVGSIPLVAPQRTAAEQVDDLKDAVAWFTAESPVLLRLVPAALSTGHHRQAWLLAWGLRDYLDHRRQWDLQITVQQAGLAAAVHLGDWTAQAHAHRNLGRAFTEQGRIDDARHAYRQAFTAFAAARDHHGQASVHMSMGLLAQRHRQPHQSLHHYLAALKAFEQIGDPSGQANAMNNVASGYLELDQHDQALEYGLRALDLAHTTSAWAQAAILNTVGSIWRRHGKHHRAVECYSRCVALIRSVGDRFHEAVALCDLADACAAAGDETSAAQARTQALEIVGHLSESDAAVIRTRLNGGSP